MVFSLATLLALAGGAIAGTDEAPTETENWLDVTYGLVISDDLGTLLLDGDVNIHLVERPDMGNPWMNAALEDECGESCTADDLRRLYQNNEGQQDEIAEHLEGFIEDQTRTLLGSITQTTAEVNATVDRESLDAAPQGAAYHPPLPVAVTGTSALTFLDEGGLDQDQALALFEMGARAPIPIETLVDPGTNLTLTLQVRPPLTVLDATETTPHDDTQWRIANWNNTDAATLQDDVRIGHPDVVVPEEEDLDIDVTFDLSNIKVHYIDALTGGPPATLHAEITLQTAVHALEIPPEFDTDQLELETLSADALRIALEAGLLDEAELVRFEDEARGAMQEAFQAFTGEDVPVSGGFATGTLTRALTGQPLGTGEPIELRLNANQPLLLPPEDGLRGGASGFEVTRIHHGALELPQIPTPGDRPANVTLLLPPGIDLEFDHVESGQATRTQTDDGLTAVTFSTGDGEQPTTIQGTEFVVNSPFLWSMLWPVFLLLFLVLVVLPGVVIYLVIRRRRRKQMDQREPPSGRVAGGYQAGDSDPSPVSPSPGESEETSP